MISTFFLFYLNFIKKFHLELIIYKNIQTYSSRLNIDEVAEWLRRWPAKPLGFAREGSNPFLVEFFYLLGKNLLILENIAFNELKINNPIYDYVR